MEYGRQWCFMLLIRKNRNIFQGAAFVKSSTAYSTASHAAPCVLTGTMLIYYKAELRAEMYEVKKNYQQEHYESRSSVGIASNFVERMKAVKERIDDKWRKNGALIEMTIGRRN